MPRSPVTDVAVRRATACDRIVLERLWLLFRHDMSAVTGELPGPDGSFRSQRLDAGLGEPGWAAYVVHRDAGPVGLAVVRGLDEPVRTLNSFFVVRAARRNGVGRAAARLVLGEHPGAWQIPFQEENAGAAAFWRTVAADVAGQDWQEEQRGVPGRPDLTADTWISLTVLPSRPGATSSRRRGGRRWSRHACR